MDSNVFHRHCHSQLPTAVAGDGVYLIDQSGKRYMDACGGAAVSCLGHNHPDIKAALKSQVDQLSYAHSAFFTSQAAEQLAEKLTRLAPGNLNHAYFVSGGSEAVESALKLARQYFVEKGELSRKRFVARRQSYHGNTLGALAVGGNEWRKEPFTPLLMEHLYISPCYPYRDQRDEESLYEYGQRVANELEEIILQEGADSIIGFIAEPVVGATSGVLTPVDGYFKRIREICDQYGILLILDEVMCGMGRTGTLFAHEQEGITADIVTVAKGLGAGYQPIGAMLASDEIYNTVSEGSGFFQHGHTYMAHSAATATALEVLNVFERERLIPKAWAVGNDLGRKLKEAFSDSPFIGDIRGRGLFWGLEIVQDRSTKQPFPVSSVIHKKIKQAAMDCGLMCYPMGGTIDGKNGHHILLAPPYIISTEQIDELVLKLKESINLVLPSEYAAIMPQAGSN